MLTTASTIVTVYFPNGTRIVTTTDVVTAIAGPLGHGFVTVSGKGGLSAGNPLKMDVTVYFKKDAFIGEPNITYIPIGAFATEKPALPFTPIVPRTDKEGFPIPASIPLMRQGNMWNGEATVIYNQGGAMPADLTISSIGTWQATPAIEIGSEAVTVAARTNSILISLTWVIIAFAALEVRYEKKKDKAENEERGYYNYNC